MLAGLLAADALSLVLLPDLHHEHHRRLGISAALERRLPTLKASMCLALIATRNRRRSRAAVGTVVAGYNVWASSVVFRAGEAPLAGYGLALAGLGASLLPPGVARRERSLQRALHLGSVAVGR